MRSPVQPVKYVWPNVNAVASAPAITNSATSQPRSLVDPCLTWSIVRPTR